MFAHLIRNLSKWVGIAGCNALFARAIILAAPHHPVLTGVRLGQSAPYLDHLGENAREYGGQATADGAIDVLARVITMLGGLIGSDIALSLLDEASALQPENVTEDPPRASPNASPAANPGKPQSDHGDATS